MSIITLDKLIDDINQSQYDNYCFLRVLDKKDRELFISKIPEQFYDEIYETKKIRLSVFINILKCSKINNNYIIYRRAYEGENIGNKTIKKELTNFIVPLWNIYKFEPKQTFILFLRDIFTQKKYIRILLDTFGNTYGAPSESTGCTFGDSNHIKNIDLTSREYFISSWYNLNYKINHDDFF